MLRISDIVRGKENLTISRSGVRRILQEKGLLVVQAPRESAQTSSAPSSLSAGGSTWGRVDASPHNWVQERGPRFTLVGGIDDATGKVVGAVFREQEDQQGDMQVLRQTVERYGGSPQAIYHDRHTMFPQGTHQVDEKGSNLAPI